MNFKKDILLVDLETTGLDASRHEIIQLAAILLDRKTLREKRSFASYVRPAHWARRSPESMAVNKIAAKQVLTAPRLGQVLKQFRTLFGHNVVLAYYGGPVDMDFLRQAYRQEGKNFPFDYHYFNLWPLFFVYLGLSGQLRNSKRFTGFSLEDLMKKFKIKSVSRHDALEDCRIEAEIFRKIIKTFK